HDPPILVLDEPTAGVDIELRRQLWDNVRSLNQRGVTILLTTHYLEEAQELCDHIAIIDRGQVVANEQKHTLLQRLDYKTIWVALTEPIDSIPPQLKDSAQSNNFDCKLLHDGPYRVEIRYRARQTNAGFLLDQCRQAGLIITDVQTQESDLEDIFLQLTSHHEVGHKG
ncbi:MAG: ABC transporter ATP-binding protein, partial [Pseudomonadota bacterium]